MTKMVELLSEMMENIFIELMFPLFSVLPSKLTGFDVHIQHEEGVKAMFQDTIDEHKRNLTAGQPKVRLFYNQCSAIPCWFNDVTVSSAAVNTKYQTLIHKNL
jgi:hypothetical protein